MTEAIELTTVSHPDEVHQILALQAANLSAVLTPEVMSAQGFVTVRHDPAVLLRMNEAAPAAIAKADGRVAGYALVMLREFAVDVPELGPMFEMLDSLSWRGEPLGSNPRWFVMGQICVAEGYRGKGIFDGLYRTLAESYRDRFDFTVTEVSSRNTRSLRAHRRVGFETLRVYPHGAVGIDVDRHLAVLDRHEGDFVLDAVIAVDEALARHHAVPRLRPMRVI